MDQAKLDAVHAALFDLKNGIKIGAHTSKAAVRYSLCFSGMEAVNFLVEKLAASRSEATALMQQLMNKDYVGHMTNKKKFSDKEFSFFRCVKAPPLQGLVKEGLISVAFHDTEYFSMFAQLDSVGLRFFRAREHAGFTYPLYFVAAETISKVTQQREKKVVSSSSSSSRHEEVAESFRNSGDLSVGYQHVVWTFKPAMALWNASLKKRDAKNACFLLAGQNLTDFEFSVSESDGNELYVACSSEREKVEWLIALDWASVSTRKAAPDLQLVPYAGVLGLPQELFGDCKDYGSSGIPVRTAVLEADTKCSMLRFVGHRSDQTMAPGWKLRSGLLIAARSRGLVFGWNGLLCSPVSDRALQIGWIVFDGSRAVSRTSKKELAKLAESTEGEAATVNDVLLIVTSMIDALEKKLPK
jgi:hypothetical protein